MLRLPVLAFLAGLMLWLASVAHEVPKVAAFDAAQSPADASAREQRSSSVSIHPSEPARVAPPKYRARSSAEVAKELAKRGAQFEFAWNSMAAGWQAFVREANPTPEQQQRILQILADYEIEADAMDANEMAAVEEWVDADALDHHDETERVLSDIGSMAHERYFASVDNTVLPRVHEVLSEDQYEVFWTHLRHWVWPTAALPLAVQE